jgi:hypothetical protein
MNENKTTTEFEDPFAGTPKAAAKTSYGIDNICEVETLRKGIIYEENGLMGMKDEEGKVICNPEYTLIVKCLDYVFFLNANGSYRKVVAGCEESGYMEEEDRPYVMGIGKVGFKVEEKVVIPPVYDYVRYAFGNETFYAEKDGRFLYLDINGKEVLTRIRWFDKEDRLTSPFYLRTGSFDFFTAMNYVGRPDPDNPNVIPYYGAWVELTRYNKMEVEKMLLDPDDDLALTEKNLSLLRSDFSYEYSLYFANAQGKAPLEECMRQFKAMDAFDNSWHYVVKLWQAPGEQVSAKDLRDFRKALKKTRQLGNLVIAVGHDEALKPGEVRMLLITHYHERCWPQAFEYEWQRKCRSHTIKELKDAVPELKQTIDKVVLDKYKEEVFLDQLRDVIVELEYNPFLSWEEVESALDFFYQQGSPCKHAVRPFLLVAEKEALSKKYDAVAFYLRAVMWALNHGADVNGSSNRQSSLDVVRKLISKSALAPIKDKLREVEAELLKRGAKTKAELDDEENTNTDYYKELETMRLVGEPERPMPAF